MSKGTEAMLELGANVVAPTVALLVLSDEARLGPVLGLVVALAFPFAHAARGVAREGRFSPLTVLAVVSVALTGGIGLLELDARWFAVKEALVPTAIGLATLGSLRSPWPVVETILWRVLDEERVVRALVARGTRARFERRIARTTLAFGGLFAGSGLSSFLLARYLVVSSSGTPAFNEELGRFTALSFPVVAVPVTIGMVIALRILLAGIEEDTGQLVDDLLMT